MNEKIKDIQFIKPEELGEKNTSQKAIMYQEVADKALIRARETHLRMNIPNVFSKAGKIYYELPDGTITTEKPWDK